MSSSTLPYECTVVHQKRQVLIWRGQHNFEQAFTAVPHPAPAVVQIGEGGGKGDNLAFCQKDCKEPVQIWNPDHLLTPQANVDAPDWCVPVPISQTLSAEQKH